jgi:hypothetical protein
MNRRICKYSIIRFQPYAETEEFANIGIVLYVPELQHIEFKILDARQHGRITHFFKPFDNNIFRHTTQIMQAELKHVQLMQKKIPNIDLFAELTDLREDIIRYSNIRVLYSEDLTATLNKLFSLYVQRSFIQDRGHEARMTGQVRNLLQKHNLANKFKDQIVGDKDIFSIRFPFVHNNEQKTVIKPIHFKHSDSSQLIKHGLSWLGKVNQLSRYNFLKPETTLFAYAPPEKAAGKLQDAFSDICDQIQEAGICMIDINDQKKIAEFAEFAENTKNITD